MEQRSGVYRVREEIRAGVVFERQDIGESLPGQHFGLILCRNLAFTYFAPELQAALAPRLIERLHHGGALVVGLHETLPAGLSEVEPWPGTRGIFRRRVAMGAVGAH
jgi:chemotaxis protein methyltransferase CheR